MLKLRIKLYAGHAEPVNDCDGTAAKVHCPWFAVQEQAAQAEESDPKDSTAYDMKHVSSIRV